MTPRESGFQLKDRLLISIVFLGLLVLSLAWSLKGGVFASRLVTMVLSWLWLFMILFIHRLFSGDLKLISPLVFFPTLYLTYLTIGFGLPVKWIFPEIPFWQWSYHCMGLLFFIGGVLITTVIAERFSSKKRSHDLWESLRNNYKQRVSETALTRCLSVLFFIGLVATFLVLKQKGLPFISDVSTHRWGESHRVSGYLLYFQLLLQIAVVLLIFRSFLERRLGSMRLSIIVLGTVLMGLVGSRTNFGLIFMIVLISYITFRSRFALSKIILFGFIILIAFSLFGLLRIEAFNLEYYKARLDLVDFPTEMWPMAPAYFSIKASLQNFALIVQTIPDQLPYWNGNYLLSSVQTILPGRQLLGCYVITEQVLGQDWHEIGGAAVTFIGSFYVDAGIWGIIAGMFLAGFLAQSLFELLQRRETFILFLLYVTLMTNYAIWIYGGFFPNPVILWHVTIFLSLDQYLKRAKS